jgi:hypothetical protein
MKVLLATLGTFWLASCGAGEEQAACTPLQRLDPAVAPADASAAFAKGDRSLRGVYGYTRIVPEAEGSSLPVQMIDGTSDEIANDYCGELNDLAGEYAAAYNRTKLALIKSAEPSR